MTRTALRRKLKSLPLASEELPFGPDVWVYKVCGKVFALLTAQGDPPRLSLKCDPVRAQELRAAFPAITPGYHLNKEHWNTLVLDSSLPAALVTELIEHSFDCVASGLKKLERQAVELARSMK